MTEQDLLALIEQEESNSIGMASGQLAEQRRKALAYYYGEPYGNEVEGRSQIVTTEVFDAVEGMLPALISIFASTDDIVRFEPQNQNDEPAAQQATDYINYLFTRANNGFVVLYCMFKDALLQKNGFCKVYWEDYEEYTKEKYQGLDDMGLAMLLQQNPDVEIVEHSQDIVETPNGNVSSHDVTIKKVQSYGKVCIDPVPPEEIIVSRETANDLKSARFVAHRTKKSISYLRECGFEVPDDVSDSSDDGQFVPERVERNIIDDNSSFPPPTLSGASREVWVVEAYIRVDYDDDGIAELRKVTKVGNTILKRNGKPDNVEVDSIPFINCTPILMPHKLFGMSIADAVMDIQLTKSTITRQLMDNAYNANNGRYAVLDGAVNISDLLTSRPGGIVRMKVPGAVTRLDTPILGAPTFQLLQYWDQVKDSRVGPSPTQLAVDPDVLNAKAHVAEIARSSAMMRIELIARIFAETGVKDLFWRMFELVSKYQNKPQTVRLRDQWVQVDPREWTGKFDMSVTVGLGTGSQSQILNGAMGILQIQQGMLQAGLGGQVVLPKNAYEAGNAYAMAVFPKKAGNFFTNPETVPPPQPKPDEKAMVQMQKAQLQAQTKDKQLGLQYQMHKETLVAQAIGQASSQEHDMQTQGRDMMHEHVQSSMDRGMKMMEAKHAEVQQKNDQQNSQIVEALRGLAQHQQQGLESVWQKVQGMDQNQAQTVQAFGQAIQSLAENQKATFEQLAAALSEVKAEATKPKKRKVVRDKNDRIVGLEDV